MNIEITSADLSDMKAILELQYSAYQSEARIVNDFTIQPLTQTLDQITAEFHKGTVLKAVKNDKIIGSVRAFEKEGTVYIGKLIVAPKHQGKGAGKRLLAAIEQAFPNKRYELFTSCKSKRNLHLYESSGYMRFKEEINDAGIPFAYLEKRK